MTRIPLGKTDFSRSVAQIPDIALVNRYFETDPTCQKDQVALLCRPGLRKWLTMAHSPVRSVYSQPGTFGEAIFAAAGNTIYKIAQDETVTAVGTIDSSSGFVSMAATDTHLFIADGLALHYYTENEYAHGTLTASGAITSGDKVQIGSTWYQFTSGDVETGTPDGSSSLPWLVAMAASTEEALTNLSNAMTGLGAAGTDYSSAIIPNADASPITSTATTLQVRAMAQGADGNSVATTETGANLAWGAATLTGGGGTNFAAVTVPDDDGIVSVGVIASFVICVVAQGQGKNGRFYWIEPGETIIDALNFATAERSPDPVWQVIVWGDQFWLPGSSTTEVWYPTGDANAPFQRQQGRLFDKGIWEGTIVQVKDSMMCVGTDGTVYKVTDVPEVVSTPGIAQRLREAINAQRSAVVPYDDTPRVSIDFKNGVYSIGGVSKTLSEVVEHNTDVGAYSNTDVISSTGLSRTTSGTTSPALTSAAFAAATAGGTAGFAVVLTVSLTGTASQLAKALVSYAPADESTAYEGFAENFNSDNSTSVYDYGSQTQNQDFATTAMTKAGFQFTPTALKTCTDGGTVATTGTPQSNTAAMIYLQARAGGSSAVAIIEKAEFFAPTTADTDFQALTA